jgi:hypothetical protein
MQQSSSTENVQNVCGNMKFPATKKQILEEARKSNMSSDVISALESCPDRQYNSCDDIMQQCKGKMMNR